MIGHSANKVKNTEAKKLSKYHGSKRSKADIIPYSKKEREIRYGIVSTRGTKSLAVQKDRKGIRKAHSFKTVKET